MSVNICTICNKNVTVLIMDLVLDPSRMSCIIQDMHSFHFPKQGKLCMMKYIYLHRGCIRDCGSVSSQMRRPCFGTKKIISLQRKGTFSIARGERRED